MTHADIGHNNRIESLCGLRTGGLYLWQDLFNIKYDGKLSAEITCERGKTTAQFVGNGRGLTEARDIARRQSK